MEKKYILTDERREIVDRHSRHITLYKIVAVKDFDVYALHKPRVFIGNQKHIESKIYVKHVKAGESGGWVETESNLSQEGNAWIDRGAVVFGNATIEGDAWVGGKKTAICGEVLVCDEAKIFSDDMDDRKEKRTDISGNIKICGRSKVTASLQGKGIIKNILIERPAIAVLRYPEANKSSQTLVRFECVVGDKKLSRQYTL